ncbi:hypothetical protein ANCCAN_16718, partial [Ancylostoma caninum]
LTVSGASISGNPPNLPPLKPSDQCNKAAHYDAKRKKCVCNNPDTDGRLKDPDRYGHYPEGIVCFDCANSTISRSVVFILDNSASVYEEGWVAQKEFMVNVSKLIKDIRVGLVIISGAPHVEIEMDFYENNKAKIDKFVKKYKWGSRWKAVGVALYKARKLLEVFFNT